VSVDEVRTVGQKVQGEEEEKVKKRGDNGRKEKKVGGEKGKWDKK
jgi:hypothetical protein